MAISVARECDKVSFILKIWNAVSLNNIGMLSQGRVGKQQRAPQA